MRRERRSLPSGCGGAESQIHLTVRPRNGAEMFRYRLHTSDGDDLGEATYAMMIKLGEEIHLGAGQHFRVVAVVPFEEEDESLFVGCCRSRRRSPGD